MNIIINILKNYWVPIVGVLCLILSFILQLFKKKPQNTIIDESAFADLVTYVIEAENLFGSGNGHEKLLYVCKKYCESRGVLDWKSWTSVVSVFVDKILNTPQKKGDKDGQ